MPTNVSPEEAQLLEREDPELVDEIQRERERLEEIRCPQPELGDILNFWRRMRSFWQAHRVLMGEHRQMRYLRDEMPEKWADKLEGDTRVRTRLTHNEILRVGAAQSNGKIKIQVPPAGADPEAIARAKKQERWLAQFLPAMERRSPFGLRRRFVDAQNGDGYGVYELYLTGKYDGESFDQGEDEDDDAYLERTEKEILAKGECGAIGLRWLDSASVFFEPGDDDCNPASFGKRRVIIAQRQAYRDVYVAQAKNKGLDKLEELRLPKPGDHGWPMDSEFDYMASEYWDDGYLPENDARGDVETLRYYDDVWMVEVIGNTVVTCERHRMPGIPVFIGMSLVTSSSNLSEAVQGVTWGMMGLERAANDLATHQLDVELTYGRPAPIAEAPSGASEPRRDRQGNLPVINLSDPSKVKVLPPGYAVTDAYREFRGRIEHQDIAAFISLWERNGMNPILGGQAAGAGDSGYESNLLMGAAATPYKPVVENEEHVLGQVYDFARLVIRDTVKERCYLNVPMEDKKVGGTEWLGLGPEDVDETPCVVRINTTSDANRLALFQMWREAHAGGYARRERVQSALDIEDFDAEDIGILEDEIESGLVPVLRANVFERVRIAPPAPQILGPNGEPLPPSGQGQQQGGEADPRLEPAEPQGVGRRAAAASQGFTSKARAGQASRYEPKPGVNQPGARV